MFKQADSSGNSGRYCVKLYSRRAALVSEYYLNARELGLPDLEAAEAHLRETLVPCEFAATVSLTSGEGSDSESIVHFELARP